MWRRSQRVQHQTEEVSILSEVDPLFVAMFSETYAEAKRRGTMYEDFFFLGEVFDDVSESTYFDAWSHITTGGNQVVVDRMLEVTVPVLSGRASCDLGEA